jgi:hypothetical protein
LNINYLVNFRSDSLEKIGIGLFANLTLKSLPVHAHEIFGLLSLKLSRQPVPKALEVHKAHTTLAFTRHDARVFLS